MRWRFLVAAFTFAIALLGGVVMADGLPLESLRWQSRIVVVLAGAPGDAMLDEQLRLLDEASAGLRERDMVVVEEAGDGVSVNGIAQPEPASLREAYDAPSSGFQVLLIGKDGGVKLRSAEPVGAGELFALIDTMPMRRREMQERS